MFISSGGCFMLWMLLLTQVKMATTSKPYKMVMLNIVSSGGLKPQNGRTCRGAAEYVLGLVNNGSTLLPDYELSMDYEDEMNSYLAAQDLISFTRRFEGVDLAKTNVYPSPITVGPFLSDSCQAIGKAIHHIYMTTVATACSALPLEDRRVYPNLHLMILPDNLIMTTVQFFKSVGNWNRIAMITTPLNFNDYNMAVYAQNVADTAGLTVSHFDLIVNPDEDTMTSLKNSGARVVAVYNSNSSFMFSFFCESLKAGITGTKYLFSVSAVAFIDPRALPEIIYPGCNRSAIIEQYKYTIFITLIQATYPGQQGNIAKYDAWIDDYLNHTKPGDYMLYKYVCHDTFMRAVLALDWAEKALKLRNMSLRDFGKSPQIVMKYVNDSVSNTNYTGMLYAPLKFVDGTELLGAVADWSPVTGLSVHSRIERNLSTNHTAVNDFWSYRLVSMSKLGWDTYGGHPPRDGALTARRVMNLPIVFTVVIIVISDVNLILKAAFIALTLHYWQKEDVSAREHSETRVSMYFPRMKLSGYVGCVFLDIAAILFALNVSMVSPHFLAVSRICFLVAGISLVNAVLILRILLLEGVLLLERSMSSFQQLKDFGIRFVIVPYRISTVQVRDRQNTVIVSLTPDVLRGSISATDQLAMRWLLIFVAIYAVSTVLWLTCNPLQCWFEPLSTVYEPETDTEFTNVESVCRSKLQVVWMSVMWLTQFFFFPFSLMAGYRIRQRFPACPEHKNMRIGLNNALMAQMAVIVIVLLFLGSQSWQFAAMSLGSLAVSTLSSVAWAFPTITKLLGKFTNRNIVHAELIELNQNC